MKPEVIAEFKRLLSEAANCKYASDREEIELLYYVHEKLPELIEAYERQAGELKVLRISRTSTRETISTLKEGGQECLEEHLLEEGLSQADKILANPPSKP